MALADKLPEEDQPNIRPSIPGIRSQEEKGAGADNQGEALNSTGEKGFFNSEGDGKGLAGGLAAAERGGKQVSEAGRQATLSAAGKATGTKPLIDFVQRHKGKGLAGGLAATIVIIIILLVGAIVPYELVTLEKDMIRDVAKVEQHFEKKAAQAVLQKVLTRLREKTRGTPQEKQQIAQEDAAGGELTNDIDHFPITDSEVKLALAKQGITVETDSNGNFTGLKDAAGNDITDQVGTDEALFQNIDAALPEWNVGQLKDFEPLMTEHAGSTFNGIPEDTAPNEVDQTIESDITKGATAEDIISAQSGQESEGQQPANNSNPSDAATAKSLSDQGGALGKSLNTTNQALANGESGQAAVEAGVKAFDAGNPVFVSSLATTACSLKSSVDQASKQRVPLIMKLLTRHFTLILTLADQLKTGKVNGQVINKVMHIFNGDPSVKPTASDPRPEASLSFTSSAAWQRITGGPIDSNPKSRSYTPDISKSALPTANAGTQIVNEIDGVANVTGGSLSCSILTSPFGFIVQGIAGTAQLIGDIGSFGLSQAAITGGILATQETLQRVVLPDIIKYFTPVGMYGGEDSVQWANNGHAGGILGFSDYSRSIGGQPLTNKQAKAVVEAANQDQLIADRQQSWSNRTFAFSNPDSLVSRLAVTLPIGLHQTALSMADFMTSFPSTLLHDFGALFSLPQRALALTSPQNPGEAYGITEYALTDDQVNKYDVVANEQYLNTTVTYGSKTAKRLDMAGDPNQFQDGVVDSSTTDLLHCFEQGYDDGSSPAASNDSNDSICASLGNYDYNVHAPTPMTDDNVAVSYCDYLTGVSSSPSQDCINAVKPQLNDDIGHFTEYIANVHAMHAYKQFPGSSS